MKFQIGYDDDCEPIMIDMPSKREVCYACDGYGVTTAHVESDGGGFTGSEWAEMDSDFREGYMTGRYDRLCPNCKGQKVVDTIDYECLLVDQPEDYKRRIEFEEEQSCQHAERESELRWGC